MGASSSIVSYWDGDSWEDFVVSSTSRLISLTLTDTLQTGMSAQIRISNPSSNPLANSGGSAKGPFTGVVDDFTPIKIRDKDTNHVYFYGMAVDVEEKFDNAFGMIINIVAEDQLFELRDNSTKGSYSYMINADTVTLEATAGEAIDSSETTITVSDTSEMFAGMRIKIDSEEMSILDVADATTIEVVRAANATTAATHSDGAAILEAAPELHEYVLATSAKNTSKKEYLQRISSRTGLIKSFLNHYSTNIDFPQRHTTLAEALDNSETGVDVGDTSNLNVNDVILIDDEQMLITAISAPTLTVTRGYNSTTAVTHINGENVFTVDDRFTESLQKYRKSMIYKLDGRSKRSALKHVALAADTEPHTTTSSDQLYGFDFYVAPNLSSTATSHKPDTYFNYFKKGTRPTTNSLGPAAFGLNLQLPTPDTLTDGAFVETGRMIPITEANLTRPKKSIYTDAAYSFAVSSKGDEGDAVAVPQTEVFEIIKITGLSSTGAGALLWSGYDIAGGVAGTDSSEMGSILVAQLDDAINSSVTTITLRDESNDTGMFGDNPTDTIPVGATVQLSGERLRVTAVDRANDQITVVRGVDGTSASSHVDGQFMYYYNAFRIQYLSNTAGATGNFSTGEEAYLMISDIDKQIDNNSLIWRSASNDTDSRLMTSSSSGHAWRLKERPRMKFGVRRTFNADTGAETNPDAIREQIASVLIRKSNSEVRGDVSTFNPPTFYIDNVPSSVATTSGSDQTITIGNTQLHGTLNEDLDTSETGIDVTDSTGMYVGQRIKIDSEEFAITAVNSKTLITANRAQNSTSAATHTSGATIFDSNVNIQNYGFYRGMLAVELDSNGQPSGTYGYASRVTSTTVRVTWATGTVDTSSTIRYYIPVRAGDTIKVRNDLANVDSTALITQSVYEEGQGISRTRYDIVGADTNKEGGSGKSSIVSKTSDAVATDEGLPAGIDISNDANITTSCAFSSSSASQVNWGSGNIYIGSDKYSITGGDTSSLEALNSDGRVYFIYYIKGDTTFRVIAKSNYPTFVAKRKDNDIRVIAHVHYDLPYAAWSLVGIKGGNVGDNTRVTGTQAQMRNFYADDGGAILPGFSFASDPDTGMYRTTSNTIGFSLNNSTTLVVHSSGINVAHSSISGTNAVINTSSGQLGTDSSSKRYKRNIVETALDSSKVYDLKPIDFEYNENTDTEGEKGFGLVAEDVEKIYPEIVHYNQDGLVESLAYDRLSLLLLMEIKKLKEEIEKLKENN
mgnify:CR=1 FL=1